MKPHPIIQSFSLSLTLCLFIIAILLNISLNSCDSNSIFRGKNESAGLFAAKGPLDEAEKSRIQDSCSSWYARILEPSVFNGGILVAREGHIIFEQYRGEALQEQKNAMDSNTPVHIASVSKTFTAVAVLKLCDERKADLEDSFDKFFPGFPYPAVTIRTLLNHRSGLPNYTSFMDATDWDKQVMMSNRDLLQFMISNHEKIPPASKPDRHFSYCNTNYALLAMLIEKISGMSYPEYLDKELFKPIGMNNSFVLDEKNIERATPSFDFSGDIIPDNYLDRIYGDKNIYSTPRDLLKWESALRSGNLISESLLEEAYKPYSNEKPGTRNYGLGWRLIQQPDGNKLIYHNGWWHGNNAVFIRIPSKNAVIIVLGSRFTKAVYKARELVAHFIEDGSGNEAE